MKLSYRGTNYEKDPSILEMDEGNNASKYRGSDWKYNYPRHITELNPKLYRKYRGVAYGSRPTVQAEDPHIFESESIGKTCPLPVRKTMKPGFNELEKNHLDNIRRNLERRLQIAQAKGDENLVNMLEQEYQQLAFNA